MILTPDCIATPKPELCSIMSPRCGLPALPAASPALPDPGPTPVCWCGTVTPHGPGAALCLLFSLLGWLSSTHSCLLPISGREPPTLPSQGGRGPRTRRGCHCLQKRIPPPMVSPGRARL